MTLVETVRVVGVVVALWGAIITAPEGTRELGRRARAAGGWALDHLPWYHRPVNAHRKPFEAAIRPSGNLTTVHHIAWKPDAPLPEQIEILHRRTDELSARVEAVREDLQRRVAEVTVALSAADDEQRRRLDALHDDRVQRETRAAQLDAAGLPLIGAGILLLGLPDAWVDTIPGALILFGITGVILLLTPWPQVVRHIRSSAATRNT